jgi:hypothetical protein
MLPDRPEAPSPKERTMNKYQLAAFGVFAVVGLSYIVTSQYGLPVLWMILIILLVGAVLTLKSSWWLIASLVEISFKVMAVIGHVIGIIGDEIVDWCKDRKASLRDTRVPSWDDLVSDQDASRVEPEKPSFLDDVMVRPN